MKQEVSLYLHIPFCVQKCAYCDFLSRAGSRWEKEEYVQALIREIESYGQWAKAYRVPTVFLGGGTPSVLEAEQTGRIMDALRETFEIEPDAEITTEANPGTLDQEKLKIYRNRGMNRISMGLQSADNEELKILGRIHTWETFLDSYDMVRKAGFCNVNLDLISGLPRQTLEKWEETLKKTAALEPEHISAYSLMVEEGTPFFQMEEEGTLFLPPEEEVCRMYENTKCILEEYGYRQYEISNFAREGKACRHNLGCWERKDYLGLGLGSASLLGKRRFRNTPDWDLYLKHSHTPRLLRVEESCLTEQEAMEEFMFLGLRMTAGISQEKFFSEFHRTVDEVYGSILEQYTSLGYLVREKGRVRLSERGILVSNAILADFLL